MLMIFSNYILISADTNMHNLSYIFLIFYFSSYTFRVVFFPSPKRNWRFLAFQMILIFYLPGKPFSLASVRYFGLVFSHVAQLNFPFNDLQSSAMFEFFFVFLVSIVLILHNDIFNLIDSLAQSSLSSL